MAKVKVWNDNVVKDEAGRTIGYDFKQEYNGELIVIPAGGFVEMDREFANDFYSAWFPIQVDGMGVQTPQSYKKLRIERDPNDVAIATGEKFRCTACGEKCQGWTDLEAHIRVAHAALPRAHDPEAEADLAAAHERKKAGGAKG
jgi:hypothetical protein